MKTMLAFLLLAGTTACVPYYDPCLPKTCNPQVEYCRCVEMDRSDRNAFVDHDFDYGDYDNNNGAGSASSDAVSDDSDDGGDSNGDGSDD